MKETMMMRRPGPSIAMILWVLGTMAATSSAQSPVDWNAGDPVFQLQQRLADQPPAVVSPAGAAVYEEGGAASVNTARAKEIAQAPVLASYGEDATNEPSNTADPKLAGDYKLEKISKRRSPYVATREYCPDFVKVVINDPAASVSVYGRMADGSGGSSQEQPGYFHLTGFTAKHWASRDKYDEVQGRTRDTVFDGRRVSETESGFMIMIGGFVVDSTVLRLGFFNSDALILKHSESATALLVVPVGALIGNDSDYSCEYKRVKTAEDAQGVAASGSQIEFSMFAPIVNQGGR